MPLNSIKAAAADLVPHNSTRVSLKRNIYSALFHSSLHTVKFTWSTEFKSHFHTTVLHLQSLSSYPSHTTDIHATLSLLTDMTFDTTGKIAVAQLTFFVFAFLPAQYVLFKHGMRGLLGWLFITVGSLRLKYRLIISDYFLAILCYSNCRRCHDHPRRVWEQPHQRGRFYCVIYCYCSDDHSNYGYCT